VMLPAIDVAPPVKVWGGKEIGKDGLMHLVYAVAAGLVYDAIDLNQINTQRTYAVITCPLCGHRQEEPMPEDACLFFYECKNCHQILKPKDGWCVFCSYGSEKCPP